MRNPFKKQPNNPVENINKQNESELKKTGLKISVKDIGDMIAKQQLNVNNKVASGTQKLADEIILDKASGLRKKGKPVDKTNLMAGYTDGLKIIGLSKEYLEQRIDVYLNSLKAESVKPAEKK